MNDEIPKHRATKNRRRWCKGKAGVEHTPKCMPYMPASLHIFEEWRALVCTVCGKRLETWFPRTFGLRERSKPDWVID